MKGYFFVMMTISFAVYAQVALKWHMMQIGVMPTSISEKALLVFGLFTDPMIISVIFSIILSFFIMDLCNFKNRIEQGISIHSNFFCTCFTIQQRAFWRNYVDLENVRALSNCFRCRTLKQAYMKYPYIFMYVVLNVYALIALKGQTHHQGQIPAGTRLKIQYFAELFFSVRVVSIFIASVFGFGCWMLALQEFPLAYAYMFTSFSYVAIPVSSAILFKEPLTKNKIIGSLLIVTGICVVSIAGRQLVTL